MPPRRRRLPKPRSKTPRTSQPAVSATAAPTPRRQTAPERAAAPAADRDPFRDFSAATAARVLEAETPELYESAQRFFDGDHWQDGDGWLGPVADDEAGDISDTMNGAIAAQFTSANIIKEGVKRHVRGVGGRPPVYNWDTRRPLSEGEARSASENTTIAELRASLSAWISRVKLNRKLMQAIVYACLGQHATFRVYIPASVTNGTSGVADIPTPTSLEDALEMIAIDVLAPDEGVVYVEPSLQSEIGIARWQPVDPLTQLVDGSPIIELTYLDGTFPLRNAATIVRQLTSGNTDEEPAVAYSLGGRLTMISLVRDDVLVDTQVQSLQKDLNLTLSMLPRAMVTAGFLERIFFDAQMPGTWEYDADGTRKPDSFKPFAFTTGPATTNFMQGVAYDESDEKTVVKDPKVSYRQPVEPTPIINAAQFFYLKLLEAMNQAHIILTGEALVSGKSREQARADYDASLWETSDPAQEALSRVMETVVAFAEYLMNAPGKFTNDFLATVQCQVFAGPVSWEERKQNDASVSAGTLSTERAMYLSGIVDTDAEQAKIKAERNSRMDYIERAAKAFLSLSQGGMPSSVAARLLDLPADIISDIEDAEEAVPMPAPGIDPNNPDAPPAPNNPDAPPVKPNPAVPGSRGQPAALKTPKAPGKP